MEHRIEITWARRWNGAAWVGHGLYFADYQGQRIGEWRVPQCDGARWLLANGADRSDILVTTRSGRPAMRGGVGWFADRTIVENEKVSPRWAKWRPFEIRASDRPATVCGASAGGHLGEMGADMPPTALAA
jgi:hypothetical protein